jgi:hypothetical protein
MKKYIILIGLFSFISNFAYSQQCIRPNYKVVNQVQTFTGFGNTPLQAMANTPGSGSSLGRIQSEYSKQLTQNVWTFRRSILMPTLQYTYAPRRTAPYVIKR